MRRSSCVRHLLMSSSSTHSTSLPNSTLPPRSLLLELLNTASSSSRGCSPTPPPPPHIPSVQQHSLATLCRERLSGILSVSSEGPVSGVQEVLRRVIGVRRASDIILEALSQDQDNTDGTYVLWCIYQLANVN